MAANTTTPLAFMFTGASHIHSFTSGGDASLGREEPWSRDAELMHHYCTVTADTLAMREDTRHVWRVVKPQQGYNCSFVMHGILSIAALHKAMLVPSRRKLYLNVSVYHYLSGSQEFRAALPDTTMENWENWRPVLCFASIIVLYCLCLPARSENQRLEAPITSALELFAVVRGIRATIHPFTALITASEYAPMVYSIWPPKDAENPDRY